MWRLWLLLIVLSVPLFRGLVDDIDPVPAQNDHRPKTVVDGPDPCGIVVDDGDPFNH